MKNELISIGPITIYGYGLMIAIGIMAAYLTAEYRAKKMKLDHEQIFNIAIWCLIGGVLGSKLLYFITQIKEVIENPKMILNVSEGFVVYGGIVGGILAGLLFCKKRKLDFFQYFDLVMPSVALAQGFGRIGCFLAGCCYGRETNSPLGIVFQHSDFAPSGVGLIPIQLIMSGLNFLHFFVLIILAKKVKRDGQIAGFYLIFYSIGRFILEYFRGDLIRGSVGRFSTSQFISIFILVIGCAIVILKARVPKIQSIAEESIEEHQENEEECQENKE